MPVYLTGQEKDRCRQAYNDYVQEKGLAYISVADDGLCRTDFLGYIKGLLNRLGQHPLTDDDVRRLIANTQYSAQTSLSFEDLCKIMTGIKRCQLYTKDDNDAIVDALQQETDAMLVPPCDAPQLCVSPCNSASSARSSQQNPSLQGHLLSRLAPTSPPAAPRGDAPPPRSLSGLLACGLPKRSLSPVSPSGRRTVSDSMRGTPGSVRSEGKRDAWGTAIGASSLQCCTCGGGAGAPCTCSAPGSASASSCAHPPRTAQVYTEQQSVVLTRCFEKIVNRLRQQENQALYFFKKLARYRSGGTSRPKDSGSPAPLARHLSDKVSRPVSADPCGTAEKSSRAQGAGAPKKEAGGDSNDQGEPQVSPSSSMVFNRLSASFEVKSDLLRVGMLNSLPMPKSVGEWTSDTRRCSSARVRRHLSIVSRLERNVATRKQELDIDTMFGADSTPPDVPIPNGSSATKRGKKGPRAPHPEDRIYELSVKHAQERVSAAAEKLALAEAKRQRMLQVFDTLTQVSVDAVHRINTAAMLVDEATQQTEERCREIIDTAPAEPLPLTVGGKRMPRRGRQRQTVPQQAPHPPFLTTAARGAPAAINPKYYFSPKKRAAEGPPPALGGAEMSPDVPSSGAGTGVRFAESANVVDKERFESQRTMHDLLLSIGEMDERARDSWRRFYTSDMHHAKARLAAANPRKVRVPLPDHAYQRARDKRRQWVASLHRRCSTAQGAASSPRITASPQGPAAPAIDGGTGKALVPAPPAPVPLPPCSSMGAYTATGPAKFPPKPRNAHSNAALYAYNMLKSW